MKKTLIKVSLVVVALVAIILIPGNSKFIFGYGDTPMCVNEKPDRVVLYEPNHALLPKATGPNEVRLNWLKTNKATKYTIAFGFSSGNYIYGFPDTGDTDHFTVGNLTSGKKYYFVVRGVNGCMPGLWSMEWAVRVGGGTGGSFTSLNTNSRQIITPPNIPQPGTPRVTPLPSTNPTGGLPTYNPPQPTPPQAGSGFFQSLWHGFLGLFGR